MNETEALRAEIAELRAEIASLRDSLTHVSGRVQWLPDAAAPCTCGTTNMNCRAHPRSYPTTVWINQAPTMGAAPNAAGTLYYMGG